MIIQTIANYLHVASKDETRPALCGVHLKCTGEGLIITACDGYTLIRSNHPFLGAEPFECIIDRNDVKSLKTIKNLKAIRIVENDFVEFVGDITLCVKHVNREYPRVETFFNGNTAAGTEQICVNPEIFGRFIKASAKSALKMVLTFTGANKPIHITCGIHTGVVMPMLLT